MIKYKKKNNRKYPTEKETYTGVNRLKRQNY